MSEDPTPDLIDDRCAYETLDEGIYHEMLGSLDTANIEDLQEMITEISKDDHLKKLYFKEFLEFISNFLKNVRKI